MPRELCATGSMSWDCIIVQKAQAILLWTQWWLTSTMPFLSRHMFGEHRLLKPTFSSNASPLSFAFQRLAGEIPLSAKGAQVFTVTQVSICYSIQTADIITTNTNPIKPKCHRTAVPQAKGYSGCEVTVSQFDGDEY